MYDVKPVTTKHSVACGPACLKMLLDYYGIEADLDKLIEECGVKVNGCTAADLLRVGRAHGLEMGAWSMEAQDLLKQDRPAIAYWRYNHYVIFAGMDDGGDVWICNPSQGRYRIDAGTFTTLFSGVALCAGTPKDLPETTGMYAQTDIPKGGLFIAHDTVYRATEAILKGAEIRPGRNCDKTTLNEIVEG